MGATRMIFGASLIGAMLLSAPVAFAGGSKTGSGGSTDSGGNANGELAFFSSYQSGTLSESTDTLQPGGIYYIELMNPGGKSKLTNLNDVPSTLTFNFFTAPHNFQPDPGKWDLSNPAYPVGGTLVSGSGSPYVFKIQLPGVMTNGGYDIEAGWVHMNNDPTSPNKGEDELYFVTDPMVGGVNTGVPVAPPPSGQLPEVPYAGILPLLALGGLGFLYMRRKKAVRA